MLICLGEIRGHKNYLIYMGYFHGVLRVVEGEGENSCFFGGGVSI